MRAPHRAVRVTLVSFVFIAMAAVAACHGSDDQTSSLMGVSDATQASRESISVDDPLYSILEVALQDEYQAEATYFSAIDVYGEGVRPFARIVLAEGRHVAAVSRLLAKRGLPVPGWDAEAHPVPSDFTGLAFAEACALGFQAEVENVAMYEELIASGLPADVESVFLSLQAASEANHAPAFARCM